MVEPENAGMKLENEIISIKEDFDKVISFSQGIKEPKTQRLFDSWAKNKQYFYEKMGGNLIYELPHKGVFHLSDEEKQKKIDNFLDRINWRTIPVSGTPVDLMNFIKDQGLDFFTNITTKDFITSEGVKIPKGSKIIRAFKYLVDDGLKELQNEASMIIQEDKVEGTLCLSIHPLDFLSSSENDFNWRSCHSLDGEYRAGNLSYMGDSSTIMCYLKSDNDVKLPNFPEDVKWNNKKWRMLIHMSSDHNMIFAGRQYPFTSLSGLDIVLNQLLPGSGLFSDINSIWTPWEKVVYDTDKLDHKYAIINRQLVDIEDFVKDNSEDPTHFNDILLSNYYIPQYSVRTKQGYFLDQRRVPMSNLTTTKFLIGSPSYCLYCGKGYDSVLSGADTMMCESCEIEYGDAVNEYYGYCDCCSRRFALDEGYLVDDVLVCEDCYQSEVTSCDRCGEPHFNQDIIWDEEWGGFLCDYCENEVEEERKNSDKTDK